MDLSLIFRTIDLLVQALTFAIFLRVLLSWVPLSPRNPFVQVIHQVTEPILGPIRRVVPRLGIIDISPVIAILILQVIGNLIV